MTLPAQQPEDCQSMEELRSLIDRIDGDLVRLLALRQGCIDRASALKGGLGWPAAIPARVDEVLKNVGTHATREGLDGDLAQELWTRLIAWSIAREEVVLGNEKGGSNGQGGSGKGD